jgi:lysophospholipase L1-like esterase
MLKKMLRIAVAALLACPALARAELPWDFADNTKYLAMGDSLAAGYGAFPVTLGYAYQLYYGGAYDRAVNTTFANAAVPDAKSADVLAYQVPQAHVFKPNVITLSVGGNDLLALLGGPPPTDQQVIAVLQTFGANLTQTLGSLCTLPGLRKITVGNLYSIQGFPLDTDPVVHLFNDVVASVVQAVNVPCGNRIKVADVYGAFLQNQRALLLFGRPGAHAFEPHPSTAGHTAMAAAFRAAR